MQFLSTTVTRGSRSAFHAHHFDRRQRAAVDSREPATGTQELGLDPVWLASAADVEILAGNVVPDNSEPIAPVPLLSDDDDAAVAQARESLSGYAPAFQRAYETGLRSKLELTTREAADAKLGQDLLR